MNTIVFDGQQTDEVVLYVITTHPIIRILNDIVVIASGLFLLGVFFALWQTETIPYGIPLIGVICALLWIIGGILWQELVMKGNRVYLTDRRCMRFERVTPVLTTKRSLFWSDVLKAKAFSDNMFWKKMNVGTLQIEPVAADGEDVKIPHVYYAEDLANYIDKILYVSKTAPATIGSIKPFVAQSKWQRGAEGEMVQ